MYTTWNDVLKTLRPLLDDEIYDSVETLKLKSPFSPALLLDPFVGRERVGDKVELTIGDITGSVSYLTINAFFQTREMVKEDPSLNFQEEFFLTCEIGDSLDYDYFTEAKPEPTSGQGKILGTFLECLVDLPTDELDICVVGYAAPANAAIASATYDIMGRELTRAGYTGSFHLVDPLGEDRDYKVGNFDFHSRAVSYDFTRSAKSQLGKDFTLITDDAWMEGGTFKISSRFPIPGDRFVRSSPKDPSGRFIVIVSEREWSLYFGSGSHTDLFDEWSSISGRRGECTGGGSYFIDLDHEIVNYVGCSTTYGPFSAKVVTQCHSDKRYSMRMAGGDVRLGRLGMDPDWKIVSLNPNSRISCKYFGEECSIPHRIVNQLYYTGVERRILFRVPEGNASHRIGDGCHSCHRMSIVAGSFKSYSKVPPSDIVQTAVSSILGESHFVVPGQRFSLICNYIVSQSKKGVFWRSLVQIVGGSFDVTDDYIMRAVRYLEKMRVIKVTRRRRFGSEDYYSFSEICVVGSHDITRRVRWNADRTEYVQEVNGKYKFYDNLGHEIRGNIDYIEFYSGQKNRSRPELDDVIRCAPVMLVEGAGSVSSTFVDRVRSLVQVQISQAKMRVSNFLIEEGTDVIDFSPSSSLELKQRLLLLGPWHAMFPFLDRFSARSVLTVTNEYSGSEYVLSVLAYPQVSYQMEITHRMLQFARDVILWKRR